LAGDHAIVLFSVDSKNYVATSEYWKKIAARISDLRLSYVAVCADADGCTFLSGSDDYQVLTDLPILLARAVAINELQGKFTLLDPSLSAHGLTRADVDATSETIRATVHLAKQ
jgi:hypothetical protein